MKINNLTLINYRRFEHQSFVFNDHFTVLIGDNGTGKTQVLQAIVTLLSQYQSKMLRSSKIYAQVVENDVHHVIHIFENDDNNYQLRMEYSYPVILFSELNDGKFIFCLKEDNAQSNIRDSYLKNKAQEDLDKITKKENVTLPVLAYYGTSRLWDKQNKNKEGIPSRTDGYRWSLDGFVDFDELKKWFTDQEFIHLQKGTNDVPLSVMRNALANMIPECESFHFDVELKSLVLQFKKNSNNSQITRLFPKRTVLFNDLSDGYKMVLTMVFDIVKQMITLNPHLGKEVLEKTDGIILIDELDLSLHPHWQRIVVESLKKTFPLVQFIVTTHTPFIIQSLNHGEVIDLEECDGKLLSCNVKKINPFLSYYLDLVDYDKTILLSLESGIAWPGTKGVYENKSLEDVTEDVMGVAIPQRSVRLQRMYDVAKQYYAKLKELKGASSEELEKLKNELDELSAPFSDDVAYHAFLEMERQAALAEREEEK